MTTPWGDIDVSDAHVHLFSHRFFSALARQKGGVSPEEVAQLIGWQPPPPNPADLASIWAAELDRYGVDRSVLIASIPEDEGSLTMALDRFPRRFYGYFMCDPTSEQVLTRVRAALAAGMHGICLFPAMHRFSMHDERVRKILEEAGRYKGVIVFVHCGVLSVGVRKKLGLPSRFDMRYSNPIDLHPIALDHPALPFVVPHFGAGYFREALMLSDLCSNVYLDTSSSNSWVSYLTPQVTLRDIFAQALHVCGAHRLLFGTDSSFFPRGWNSKIFEAQVAFLQELEIPARDASLIFGGNLRHLHARD